MRAVLQWLVVEVVLMGCVACLVFGVVGLIAILNGDWGVGVAMLAPVAVVAVVLAR